VALTALSAAVVLGSAGRADAARAMAEPVRPVLASSGLHAKAALADLVLARTSFETGELAQAGLHLEQARRRLERHPSPTLAWQVAWLTGAVAEAQGRWRRASASYARAHRILESLRGQVVHEELKVAFLDDKAVVYDAMVALAMRGQARHRAARAFTFIEQGRSRALADLLARDWSAPGPAATDGIRTLRGRLHACHRELERVEGAAEPPAPRRLAGLRARASAVERALSAAHFDAARRDRRLADVQAGSVVSLAEVQARLGPALLLEFFAVRGHLHVLVADETRAAIVSLGSFSPVLRTVRLALFNITQERSMTARERAQHARQAVDEHLHTLWRALIAPVDGWMAPGRPLVVAAHGLLHRLPFQALRGPRGYLGEDCPIALIPSGTALILGADRETPPGRGTLVMGLADTRAPRIREEAVAVGADMAPATVLIGRRATARALRTHGRRARVVHIAAHGLFRHDNPMLSSIRLANTQLNVHDLYGLRLSADLVTLSGCATGVSLVTGGDELVGLTRGLLASGARSVHLSLWDVDDDSTTDYMTAFYRHYREGRSPAAAAQMAAAETRTRYPHPYHWAPFVVVGHAW
jgi:CHAT domain-containing protein